MTRDELKLPLTQLLPGATFEEGSQWLTVLIEPGVWPSFASSLNGDESLKFDYLFCLTCIDWKSHLTMVYHLESTIHRHVIVVKSNLDRQRPEIETVSNIWRTAEFHEREVFELFGVNFKNHPDLRLLILPDGWEGKISDAKRF